MVIRRLILEFYKSTRAPKIENAELRERLNELAGEEVTFPSNLVGPDDELTVPVLVSVRNANDFERVERQEEKQQKSR